MRNKHMHLMILLIIMLCNGCSSTYDPDDPIIERNFWNRDEALDGVYVIFVRGDIVEWKHGIFKIGDFKEDERDFDGVKKIYAEAKKSTCVKGVKEEVRYNAYLKAETLPTQSSDLPFSEYISIRGPIFVEPYIEAVIQCEGSTATTQEINQRFRMEEILVEETMSKMELNFDELVEGIDDDNPES